MNLTEPNQNKTICSNPGALAAQRHHAEWQKQQAAINNKIQLDALKRQQEASARHYYDTDYKNNCVLHGYEMLPFHVWYEEFKYSKNSMAW